MWSKLRKRTRQKKRPRSAIRSSLLSLRWLKKSQMQPKMFQPIQNRKDGRQASVPAEARRQFPALTTSSLSNFTWRRSRSIKTWTALEKSSAYSAKATKRGLVVLLRRKSEWRRRSLFNLKHIKERNSMMICWEMRQRMKTVWTRRPWIKRANTCLSGSKFKRASSSGLMTRAKISRALRACWTPVAPNRNNQKSRVRGHRLWPRKKEANWGTSMASL